MKSVKKGEHLRFEREVQQEKELYLLVNKR